MKIFKRIIICVLSFILLLSSTACSCNEQANNSNGNAGPVDSTDYFIENEKSNYVVVTPDIPKEYETHAANELVLNTKEATGVTLPIKAESTLTSADTHLLIVGNTNLTINAGITADKNQYGARGFIIKKQGTKVYLLGGDTSGTLYSVYEFLHHQFGYEPYAMDEIYLEKGVKNNLLKAYDMSEIPDIPYTQGIGPYYRVKNIYAGHRMRYNLFDEIFVNATGQPWHNTLSIISPSKYEEEHPKWFTAPNVEGQRQLHYTAYGDAEELKALQEEVFNQLVYYIERDFKQNKFYEYIGFMHEDNTGLWAVSDAPYDDDGVDSVQLLKEKYGNGYRAGMLVEFINPVADKLKAYMAEKWEGRQMNITIFGYLDTETAPVKTVNGEIEAVDKVNGVLRDNVCVMLAPIKSDYTVDYGEDIMMKTSFETWTKIASKIAIWFYDYYFSHQTSAIMYMDSAYSLKGLYQAAKAINAQYVFNETPVDNNAAVSFTKLKLYLTSKLTWDTELDDRQLIDNFFTNYFKEASATMRKYFEELRTYIAMQKAVNKFPGVGSSDPTEKRYWEEGVLKSFMGYIEQAYKDIEPLKATDYATYQKLHDRITQESFNPRCLILKYYGKEMYETEAEFILAVKAFKDDCTRFGIKSLGEKGDINNIQFNYN